MKRARSSLLLASVVALSGCVYYNGVYNAQNAAKKADTQWMRDNESAAQGFYQESAAKAESVLVRHPTSSWRTRSLYLAGRGEAFSGQCPQAVPRLTEFLTRRDAPAADRDRARIAMAACDLRSGNVEAARIRLDSLLNVRDPGTARQAHVWAARAALAAGDRDAVAQLLGAADDGALPWELLLSSLSAREYERAESLLVRRTMRGDYREDVPRALRELWAAGRWDGVEAIVRGYDASRIRDAQRAAMHFAVGDLDMRAGRDSLARQHLFTARTLAGRDTLMERESAARLSYMTLQRVASMREVDTLVARQDSALKRTPFAQRVNEHLLLLRLLLQQQEPTGAAQFLAAEVARDSLRAMNLARVLFLRVAREMPGAPLAPQALYAASVLTPDSAAIWHERIQRDFPTSAVAAWLKGDDPASRTDFSSTPPLLQLRWDETLRIWSDSVRKLRTPVKTVPAPIRK